jgi:hypothetical protein
VKGCRASEATSGELRDEPLCRHPLSAAIPRAALVLPDPERPAPPAAAAVVAGAFGKP